MVKKDELRVNHHSASTIVFPEGKRDIMILDIYDDSYPPEIFRGNFHFIGGNARKNGPRQLLAAQFHTEANLLEPPATVGQIIGSTELDVVQDVTGRLYAPKPLRTTFMASALENAKPYGDFIVDCKGSPIKKKDVRFFVSAYISEVDGGMFDEVAEHLRQGHQITNESLAKPITIDELVNRAIKGAWGHATILGRVLNADLYEHPFLHVSESPISTLPLDSFKEYRERGVVYKVDP